MMGVGREKTGSPEASMKKILVVDDNTTIIMLIKTKLAANGFDVISAYNGESGWQAISREKPDLVLLDIMMPRMDGFQVFEKLLSEPSTNGIPVIFLTASGQREDEKRAMEMGAKHFLTKPFSPNNLLEIVNGILGTGEAA
jgi:CheY-like chemotaxis protein